MFAVGLYAHGCLGWLTDFKPIHLLKIICAAALAISIRSYFLPIMGAPLALAFFLQTRRPFLRALMLPLFVVGSWYSITTFSESMKLDSFQSFVAYQGNVSRNWQGGSSFVLPVIDTPLKLALVAPLGVLTALFRPTLLEAHNPFALAAAVDNTILLIMFLYALKRSRRAEILQPPILWMSAFVIVWSVMYGLGTGNLGAISRFKIQVLPIFISLLLYLSRKRVKAAPLPA